MEKTKTDDKKTRSLSGLYAITRTLADTSTTLVEQVEQAILGGTRIIQYRDKSLDQPRRRRECQSLLTICRQYHIPLIINDDVALAKDTGADGVHLGADDPDILQARKLLGPRAIIGISCYNQISLAEKAQRQGADYVAFGRFFPSRTKPHAIQAELDLLVHARQCLDLPIAAIGGITAENAETLYASGADMLAVVDAVFGRGDIQAAAKAFPQPAQAPTQI